MASGDTVFEVTRLSITEGSRDFPSANSNFDIKMVNETQGGPPDYTFEAVATLELKGNVLGSNTPPPFDTSKKYHLILKEA